MQRELDEFLKLSKIFSDKGFHLYLVGGSVRDFLIFKQIKDFDLATDATPEEISSFVENCDMTFSHLGTSKIKTKYYSFLITTFRKESAYKDSRHPSKITFVKDMKIDVKRRDFTINGLYMDDHFKVYDFIGGENDINKKIIRMIGKPSKRIKEDPLRIIRAIRFSLEFGFTLDKKLEKTIRKKGKLLLKLNQDKVRQEIKKMDYIDSSRKEEAYKNLNVFKYLADVVK